MKSISRQQLAYNFLRAPEFERGTGPRLTTFLLYATFLQRDPTTTERNTRMAEVAAGKPIAVIATEVLATADFANQLR